MMRYSGNPLITPQDITPSHPGFKVECAFNAGITKLGDETIMLIRIAESVIPESEGITVVPLLMEISGHWQVTTRVFKHDDPAYDFSDPRLISDIADPSTVYLTSLSHLRVARSHDGVTFVVTINPLSSRPTVMKLLVVRMLALLRSTALTILTIPQCQQRAFAPRWRLPRISPTLSVWG